MSSAVPSSLSVNSHNHVPVKKKDNLSFDSSLTHSARPGTQDENLKSSVSTSRKACFSFQKTGNCRFGSSCKFQHGQSSGNEAGHKPRQSSSQRGKKIVCSSFSKKGHCRFGVNCKFVHGGETPHEVSSGRDEGLNGAEDALDEADHALEGGASVNQGDEVKPKKGTTGGSKPGDGSTESRNASVEKVQRVTSQRQTTKTRSRVCRYFKRGSCKQGLACPFTHPDADSKSTNVNSSQDPMGKEPLPRAAMRRREGSRIDSNPSPRPRIQVQTFLRLAELTDADLTRLRETELKQLRQRFPDLLEMENDGQPSIYRIVMHPTDPDWPFDLRDFHLNVSFPFGYPVDQPYVSLPEDQDIPSVILSHLTSSIHEWLQAKHEMNKMAGRVELIFRPFLRWFDRSLENKFTEGAREFKKKVEFEKSGFEFIPNEHKSLEEKRPSQPTLPEDALVISEPKGQQFYGELKFPKLPLDWSEPKSSEEEDVEEARTGVLFQEDGLKCATRVATPIIYDPPDKDMRGTEIVFRGLKMSESVATLAVVKLTMTVHCARCKESTDLTTPPRRNNLIVCGKCNNRQIVTYRPCLVHQLSRVIGFLDLSGCLPFDVNLATSTLMVGCLSCSHDNSLKGIQYGQTRNLWCEKCHQKMTIQAESCRFQRLQPAENIGTGPLFSIPVKGPRRQPKDPAIVDMQPLPDNGSCKHYKKSFRWLRFPCCGKFYACDECHDLDNLGDHEMKFATRMLCGFCAKEQPFSTDKPCVRCGSSTTKGRSKHWEGGTGCRNRVKMSRNDKQKYAGTNKTVSKKSQNKTDSSKKGKPS